MKVKELIKVLDLSDSCEILFNIGNIRQIIYTIPSSDEKEAKNLIAKDIGECIVTFISTDDDNYVIDIKEN